MSDMKRERLAEIRKRSDDGKVRARPDGSTVKSEFAHFMILEDRDWLLAELDTFMNAARRECSNHDQEIPPCELCELLDLGRDRGKD